MKEFIALLIVICLLVLLVCFAIDRHEKTECLKWKKELEIYPDYYLTNWQIEQCQYHGIELK